jgi:hypothetical protein
LVVSGRHVGVYPNFRPKVSDFLDRKLVFGIIEDNTEKAVTEESTPVEIDREVGGAD